MPSKDRVRCHDGCYLVEEEATEPLSLGSQPSSLIVGQPEAPSFELFFEDSVLLDQVLHHYLLTAVHPAGKRHE